MSGYRPPRFCVASRVEMVRINGLPGIHVASSTFGKEGVASSMYFLFALLHQFSAEHGEKLLSLGIPKRNDLAIEHVGWHSNNARGNMLAWLVEVDHSN